jgi:hypothetical protein
MTDITVAQETGIVIRTAEQWREYIQQASFMELDAILEKGRRIREFHSEFFRDKEKWGGTWTVACKNVLFLSQASCSYYETIHRVFDPLLLERVRHLLPCDIVSLSYIARAVELNRAIVSKAAADEILSSEMNRDAAQKLLRSAEAAAEAEVKDLIREGKTDEEIFKSTALSYQKVTDLKKAVGDEATELNPEDVGPDVAHEIPTPAPPAPAAAPKKTVVTPPQAAVIPPSPALSPFNAIRFEVENLTNVVMEDTLHVILEFRSEFPEVFATIAQWDAKFGPLAVTTVLKQLQPDFNDGEASPK